MNLRRSWVEQAACVVADPEWFFPGRGQVPDRALNICKGCPVINQCLEYALTHGVTGIWGGTTDEDRKALRQQGGRPKPRPFIMHGTEAGSKQHYRLGEQPCYACAEAARQQSRLRRARCSA